MNGVTEKQAQLQTQVEKQNEDLLFETEKVPSTPIFRRKSSDGITKYTKIYRVVQDSLNNIFEEQCDFRDNKDLNELKKEKSTNCRVAKSFIDKNIDISENYTPG